MFSQEFLQFGMEFLPTICISSDANRPYKRKYYYFVHTSIKFIDIFFSNGILIRMYLVVKETCQYFKA